MRAIVNCLNENATDFLWYYCLVIYLLLSNSYISFFTSINIQKNFNRCRDNPTFGHDNKDEKASRVFICNSSYYALGILIDLRVKRQTEMLKKLFRCFVWYHKSRCWQGFLEKFYFNQLFEEYESKCGSKRQPP